MRGTFIKPAVNVQMQCLEIDVIRSQDIIIHLSCIELWSCNSRGWRERFPEMLISTDFKRLFETYDSMMKIASNRHTVGDWIACKFMAVDRTIGIISTLHGHVEISSRPREFQLNWIGRRNHQRILQTNLIEESPHIQLLKLPNWQLR